MSIMMVIIWCVLWVVECTGVGPEFSWTLPLASKKEEGKKRERRVRAEKGPVKVGVRDSSRPTATVRGRLNKEKKKKTKN